MFLIIGLPRSRTAWFSAYFSACGHPCIHEGMKYCDTLDEYGELMESWEGNSDSGAMFLPQPEKVVIIERDIDEVIGSMNNVARGTNWLDRKEELIFIKNKMDKLDGFRVGFHEINDKLQQIHEYCVDSAYNKIIGEQYKNMKIELIELFTHNPKIIGELSCR